MSESQTLRKPHEWPQTFVLGRWEDEILYGWARGGGKTDAGIAWLTRWVGDPNLRALVLRHTYDDLVDRVDRAMRLYENFWAQKRWNPTEIVFPSGAVIRTGYLKNESYDKYKGHEYQKMIIEELTQIPSESHYEKLLGSLRSKYEWLKPQIFCTTNPDGAGRVRVKKRFVDVWPPNKTYTTERGRTRIFIPARVYDNLTLMRQDPWYIRNLEDIKDDQLRKAWLHGDWDAYDVKGGIYTEQIKQLRREERVGRIPVDQEAPTYAARDIGMGDAMAIIIFQVFRKEIRILGHIESNGQRYDYYLNEIASRWYKIHTHFLPHDASKRSLQTSKTDLDFFNERGLTTKAIPRAKNLRTEIEICRRLFAQCFFQQSTTEKLIENLEMYRKEFNETRQVFENKPRHWPESHSADAFRYMLMAYDQFLDVAKEIQKTPPKPREIYNPVTGKLMNKPQTFNRYK